MLSTWMTRLASLAKGTSDVPRNTVYTPQFYNQDYSGLSDSQCCGSPCYPIPIPGIQNLFHTHDEKVKQSSRPTPTCGTSWEGAKSGSGSGSGRAIKQVRPGCGVVYVGGEKKRFIVPSSVMNHHLFQLLLEKLEVTKNFESEEIGAIMIPCEAEFLHRLLFLIDSGVDADKEMRWDELKKFLEGKKEIEISQ